MRNMMLPRLDRDSAIEIVDRHRHTPLADIAAAMPDLTPTVTYSPVGGARAERHDLERVRREVVELAQRYGMPRTATREQFQRFEGEAARVIHGQLPLTPYEASQEEVWSYVTCCWLLDVAVWRFGAETTYERFIGHLNRNTFRRMWWRAEIFGPSIDLSRLGEDELVNIMERPTLFSDRRLTRAIAAEFLGRLDRDGIRDRMNLMREATKRLLRLTPFVAFSALEDEDVQLVVRDAFDTAAHGLAGRVAVMPIRSRETPYDTSPDVIVIERMSIVAEAHVPQPLGHRRRLNDFDDVAEAAMDIVRRTGLVTNIALREVVPITSDEAREVFASLMERGALVRRGVKRGTHYVLPETSEDADDVGQPPSVPPPRPEPAYVAPRRPLRPSETALRRLLRRGR